MSASLQITVCLVHRIVSDYWMRVVSATPQLHYSHERDPLPVVQEAGRPQIWSRWEWKISPPPGFDPRLIQPIASCYNNYAIPAHNVVNFVENAGLSAVLFL